MPSIIERLLAERGVLLADGATGSNLFERGLQTGDAPELWNARHPRRIASQYQAFIDAGSDIILTNTFGGSRQRLQRHAAAHRVAELNRAGAAIARECVSRAGRRILIGGSMGPSGEIMQPLGALSHAAAADAFAEQAAALKDGGADVFWIETMSSREEVQAAVDGAARVGLPIVATFSVDTNGRTMMGLAPADIVALSARMPRAPDAIGATNTRASRSTPARASSAAAAAPRRPTSRPCARPWMATVAANCRPWKSSRAGSAQCRPARARNCAGR